MFTTVLAPVSRRKALSNSVVFGNAMVSVLVSGADTDGAFSMLEVVQRPGTEPPYHIHEREDETFYILEGHVSIMVNGTIIEAYAGDTAFLPRNVPHTFRVRSEFARGILVLTPSGFEDYFTSIGQPARSLEIPDKRAPRPDYFELAGKVAGRMGVRLAPQQPEF